MSTANYHHGDLRAALLAATGDVLADVGLEGLSLREVSRRARVSHAAAYNHFRDKAGLIAAFVNVAFEMFARALRRARSAATDPLDAIRRIGVAYVLFAYDRRAEFKVMFRPELYAPFAPGDPDARSASYEVLVDTLRTARDAGLIAGDLDVLVRTSWATVHGLSTLIVDGPGRAFVPSRAQAERAASDAAAILIAGLTAPAPAMPRSERSRRSPRGSP